MRPILLPLLALPLLAQPPRYTPAEALWAEWRRQVPVFSARELESMDEADRARWEISARRVQGVNAPPLLPPELDAPTEVFWLEKAAQAVTPQERFDALYFLNRLKSQNSLDAFADMPPDGFGAWPRCLRLEGQLTTAALNALNIKDAPQVEKAASLQDVWDSYVHAAPADPLRVMVSWLRLSMAGKEISRPEPIEATPHAIMALMDAWNRAPWSKRSEMLPPGKLDLGSGSAFWPALGLKPPSADTLAKARVGIMSRLAEGAPDPAERDWQEKIGAPWLSDDDALAKWYGFQALAKYKGLTPEISKALDRATKDKNLSPLLRATLLPALYAHRPKLADRWRDSLLAGDDPVARSLAMEQLGSVDTS